jgi:hypothetical protein
MPTSRVARFFLIKNYQNGDNVTNVHNTYQTAIKANGHKLYQKVIKDIKIFHSKGFQDVPNLGVWFENKPSGNTAYVRSQTVHKFSRMKFRKKKFRENFVLTSMLNAY